MFSCCYWISCCHLPVLSFPCPHDASRTPPNDHWWRWRTTTPTTTPPGSPRPPPTATPTASPSPASACHGRSERGGKITVRLLPPVPAVLRRPRLRPCLTRDDQDE